MGASPYKEVSKNGCSSSIIDILVESVTLPLLRLLRFGELFALVVSVLLKVIKSSSAELSFWPRLDDFSRLTLHWVIRIFLNDSLSRLYKMGFTESKVYFN